MKKTKATRLAVIVTATLAAAGLATPEAAFAHKIHKTHKHKVYKKKRGYRSSSYSSESSSYSSSSSAGSDRRISALEQEVQGLRSELSRSKAATDQVQQKVDQKLAEVEEKASEGKDLLFFRGGYAKMEHARNNELLLNNDVLRGLGGTTFSDPKDGEGWYVGAGFDHRLTSDLWGLTDAASVDGEVMFEYKNFGSSHNTLVEAATGTVITGNGLTPGLAIKNQLTQFTLTAAPKIKFNNLGPVRPWIIPFGLGIHVISPPSSGVTVLNPGLMVGTGVEINLWKSLWAGVDFRYHFTGDDLSYRTRVPGVGTVLNKTDIDGFTTGAFLGFGF